MPKMPMGRCNKWEVVCLIITKGSSSIRVRLLTRGVVVVVDFIQFAICLF